jgi:hypothetical protein
MLDCKVVEEKHTQKRNTNEGLPVSQFDNKFRA